MTLKSWNKPFGHDGIIAALDALASDGVIPSGLDYSRITVEPPREVGHGHVAINAAMVLSKPAGMKPRDLAEKIAERLRSDPSISDVEIAGPGFINISLNNIVWFTELSEILRSGKSYGNTNIGAGEAVNVEFVSANPTGPLHVGHGRGAVFGDALSALLEKAGYDVTREYWINDAGAQIDTLARSFHLRYREALGEDIGEIPEGLYPGDYLVPIGEALAKQYGDQWRDAPEAEWLPQFREAAVAAMLALIRDDLAALGVQFDVFTSENALVAEGKVDAALADLTARELIYEGILEPPKGKTPDDWEPRPQELFKATEFGDDVDRPLRKSDGSWTYFASDIAYHLDKFERGYGVLIDVWGADHGGYVKRMQAAVKAVSDQQGELDVKLCQMINLLDGGEQFKMSKRSGNFVTMADVIEKVGKDVFRFIMLTRKNDAQLDFDLQTVTEQSRDNPVFYVQYAHARVHSVLRMASETFPGEDFSIEAIKDIALSDLGDPAELAIIMQMANWPRLIESAALAHEPHRIAFYLYDLAAAFHGLWNKGKENTDLRFIIADDLERTRARLALLQAIAAIIASGLGIFGVTPVKEMR